MQVSTDLASLEAQARAWKMGPAETSTWREFIVAWSRFVSSSAVVVLGVYMLTVVVAVAGYLLFGRNGYVLICFVGAFIIQACLHVVALKAFAQEYFPYRRFLARLDDIMSKLLTVALTALMGCVLYLISGVDAVLSLVGFTSGKMIYDEHEFRRLQRLNRPSAAAVTVPLDELLTEYLLHQVDEQEKEFLAQSASRAVLAQVTQQLSRLRDTKMDLECSCISQSDPSEVLIKARELAREWCQRLEDQEHELREFDAAQRAVFQLCREQVAGLKRSYDDMTLITKLQSQVAEADVLIGEAQDAIYQATVDLKQRMDSLSELNQVVRKEAVFESLAQGADARQPAENIKLIETCVARLAQSMVPVGQ